MSNKIENITKFTAQIMMKKWEQRAEVVGWLEDNYRLMGYEETASELSLLRPFIRDVTNDLLTIIEANNN